MSTSVFAGEQGMLRPAPPGLLPEALALGPATALGLLLGTAATARRRALRYAAAGTVLGLWSGPGLCYAAVPWLVRARQGGSATPDVALELRLPYRFGLPIHGWAHVQEGLKHPGRFTTTRTLEVPIYTVDRVCELREIPRVDFMKVDVEGFEPEVLKGAEWTIAQHRPTLLIEIEDRHLDKYGQTAADVASSLIERGYRMHVWQHARWSRTEKVSTRRRNYLFTGR
ncbi:FkbM family methyltransferase [Nonomuraea sp. NPDC050786]|uniref:FkbM family methyltransferase n=1 Tax=Nonomuraea sp. NPDC050786 TaxID=3154840 RepID=UPI0033C0954D